MKKYFFYATIFLSLICSQSSLQASSDRSLETGSHYLGKFSSLYVCSVSDLENKDKRKEIDSHFENNPNETLYLDVKENEVLLIGSLGIPYLGGFNLSKSVRKLHIIDENGYAKVIAANFLSSSNLEELYITATNIETIMPNFCSAPLQRPNQLKKFEGNLPKLEYIWQSSFLDDNFDIDEFVLFSEKELVIPFSQKHNVKKVEFLDSDHEVRFSGTVKQGLFYQKEK